MVLKMGKSVPFLLCAFLPTGTDACVIASLPTFEDSEGAPPSAMQACCGGSCAPLLSGGRGASGFK
jgi:hypothetical protein